MPNEIKEEIKQQLARAIDELKPKGARKILQRIWEWGGAAIVVTVPIALIGIIVTLGIFAFDHIEVSARFQQKTNDRLANIESSLRSIQAAETSQELRRVSQLPAGEFASALPELKTLTASHVSPGTLNRETIQAVAQKLGQIPETSAEYWPTVLQFIRFASAGVVLAGVPPPDAFPFISSSVSINLTRDRFKNVKLVLNGGTLTRDIFYRCRVVFTNTPVKMYNVKFIDCVFEMPIDSNPSPYIKHASQQLIASDSQSVTISSAPGS